MYPVLARATRRDTHLWVYWSEVYWRDSISILHSAKIPNFTSMIDIQGWPIIILCAYRKFLMITQQWAVESVKYSNMPLLSGQILEFHLIHSPCCDSYAWWGTGCHQAITLFLYTAGNRIIFLMWNLLTWLLTMRTLHMQLAPMHIYSIYDACYWFQGVLYMLLYV